MQRRPRAGAAGPPLLMLAWAVAAIIVMVAAQAAAAAQPSGPLRPRSFLPRVRVRAYGLLESCVGISLSLLPLHHTNPSTPHRPTDRPIPPHTPHPTHPHTPQGGRAPPPPAPANTSDITATALHHPTTEHAVPAPIAAPLVRASCMRIRRRQKAPRSVQPSIPPYPLQTHTHTTQGTNDDSDASGHAPTPPPTAPEVPAPLQNAPRPLKFRIGSKMIRDALFPIYGREVS